MTANASPLAAFDRRFLDAHCHVHHDERFYDAHRANRPQRYWCMTEDPEEFTRYAQLAAWPAWGVLGLGLHPWSLGHDEPCVEAQLKQFEENLGRTWLVGEVGLDFSAAHEHNRAMQLVAFERIARACAQAGGKVLSIHAVASAGAALDILEQTACLESCQCIFHWFSGTSDELVRARKLGCFFSVGPRMLATKKGRAYAKSLPEQMLFCESDSYTLPVEDSCTLFG